MSVVMTVKSRNFRLKAAELSKLIDAETDPKKVLSLLGEALSWIQLAENEEALRDDARGNFQAHWSDKPSNTH